VEYYGRDWLERWPSDAAIIAFPFSIAETTWSLPAMNASNAPMVASATPCGGTALHRSSFRAKSRELLLAVRYPCARIFARSTRSARRNETRRTARAGRSRCEAGLRWRPSCGFLGCGGRSVHPNACIAGLAL